MKVIYDKNYIVRRFYSYSEIKQIILELKNKYGGDLLQINFRDKSKIELLMDDLLKIENYSIKRITDEIKLNTKIDYMKVKKFEHKEIGDIFEL